MSFIKNSNRGGLKDLICIIIIVSIVCLFSVSSYATVEKTTIKNNDFSVLNKIGITNDQISSIQTKGNSNVYTIKIDDETTCNVTVTSDQGVYQINIADNQTGISNTLTIMNDGTLLLDGTTVAVVTNDGNSEIIKVPESSVVPVPHRSPGGTKWYTPKEATKDMKNEKYGSYTLSYAVASIKLQKSINKISVAAFKGLLVGAIVSAGNPHAAALGLAQGFTGALFDELVKYDPSTKDCSFKAYTARGTHNKNLLKRKKIVYSKARFKGHAVKYYAYGVDL